MVRKVYKQYFRCASQDDQIVGVFGEDVKLLVTSFTFNGERLSNGSYVSAPAWFSEGGGLPYDTFWVMTPPNEENTSYDFSWTATNKDGTHTEYIVRLVMLDYCEVVLGCDNPTTSKPLSLLVWLTLEGGWCYFPFNGKKSFEVKIPDATQFMGEDYTNYNTSRKGVMRGETLSTGDIPELALDLLESLKESIQVYYVENPLVDGEQVYYPVTLMDGDFMKRKTDERRYDVKVKFVYSKEVQIQTQ